ncbi:Fatty-acid amide hydrolase 1 [Lamellibrachia satsuma]|nr:Fatty-acid amide hydrolase 1 [Lamellibrachia satsuma]
MSALTWSSDLRMTGPIPVLTSIGVVSATWLFWRWGGNWLESRRLATKRREKKESCRLALEELERRVQASELSEAKRHEILRLSLSELVEKLQSGELKAVDVLHAYQWQALAVHKKTNCLVEPVLEAEALALACDAGQRPGPLCGVPVSLKDCYGLKGYDCTVGLARWIDRPFEEDCDIVQVLKKQGAVPFVKTNVPQTMMSAESTNPIFGFTVNPHDTTQTAGGSSGGEAALIAGGGSILGFGTDVGGSVRIPAAMCGIYSLKPVDLRLSEAGCHPMLCGQKGVPNCYGPMARDVESLAIAMKALTVDSTMYEVAPATPPVPFRSQIYEDKKRLKIGFFLNTGVFRAVPCMERGVLKARDALEAAGHQDASQTFVRDCL